MRIRTTALIVPFAAISCGGAVAQYDGIGDCERFATTFYKTNNADFKNFVIDRNTVNEIGFDANVGLFIAALRPTRTPAERSSEHLSASMLDLARVRCLFI